MEKYITAIMVLVAVLFFAACEEAPVDKNNDGIDDNTGEVINDDVDAGSGEVDGDVDGDADADADSEDPEEQAFQQLKAYCEPFLNSQYVGNYIPSFDLDAVSKAEMYEDLMREKNSCVISSENMGYRIYEGTESPLVAYSGDTARSYLFSTEDGLEERLAEDETVVATYTRIK